MEVCSYIYFGGVDISEVPGCHLLRQMSSQWGSQKLLQGLVSHELTAYLSVFNLYLTQWIMAILSKWCKPDKFESHNSLKLSFTNIRGLPSNFVECKSFFESNSWHSGSMWYKLGWHNWFWQFLCDGLSSFKPYGFCYSYVYYWYFYTHIILPYVFDWLYFTQCLTFLSSIDPLTSLSCIYGSWFCFI